jgi:tetratricopeptide (TPR) repeat protein
LKNYDRSISAYEKAIGLNPSNTEIQRNLSVIARDAGRYAGEMQNDLPKAKKLLELSYKYNPTDFETVRLLGVSHGVEGNHTKALEYFLKVVELDPKNAYGYVNIANAYAILGNTTKYNEAMAKAKQLDPNIK